MPVTNNSESSTHRRLIHTIRGPATLEFLNTSRNSHQHQLSQYGLDQQARQDWNLLFTEAVSNAIKHGNTNKQAKELIITHWLEDNTLHLSVTQQGNPPPESCLLQPTLPQDSKQTHGRGLFLIDQIADGWDWAYARQTFTLHLWKHHKLITHPLPTDPHLHQALEELSRTYENLSAFHRLGALLVSDQPVATLTGTILDDLSLIHQLDYKRLHLAQNEMLVDDSTNKKHKTLSRCTMPEIVKQCLKTGTAKSWKHSHTNPNEDKILSQYAHGYCLPIHILGDALGVLTVARHNPDSPFKDADLNSLQTYADIIGLMLASRQLTAARDAERRVRQEMEIASSLQRQLLTYERPADDPRYHLAMHFKGARDVAGDYMEAVHLPDGSLLLSMFDVMGKGLSAALLAIIVRTAMHIESSRTSKLSDIATAINRSILRELGNKTMFATGILAKIHPTLAQLTTLNAGHCPGFLYKKHKHEIEDIQPDSPPFGIHKDSAWDTSTHTLSTGDAITLYTDGLYEWDISKQWNLNKLRTLCCDNHDQPDRLWMTLNTYIMSTPKSQQRQDDRTLLHWIKLP